MRIYQRGKRGTFWVDYLAPDGTRARRSLHTTSREIAGLAAEKLAGLDAEENRGTTREEAAPETLEQVLNRWLVHKAERHREKPSTVKTYRQIARNVVRHPGTQTSSSITSEDLTRYQRARLAEGRKSTTVNHEVMLLRAILRWTGISAPSAESVRGKPDRPQSLTDEEVERLLQAARGTRLEPVIVLALECGLRRDEIRHLRWCDVDLGNQLLYVQRQPGWAPKSHQARVIPLSPGLVRWLKQYRVTLEQRLGRVPHAEDPVALYEPEARARWRGLGPRWSANALSATVSKLWSTAGIPRTNRHALHALRATFASRAMLCGGDIVSVQTPIGHADIGTTRGYLNHDAESLRRAVRAASSL